MKNAKKQKAIQRVQVDEDEITLPFRIVCTRRETPDGPDGFPLEVERVRLTGKSLLEPRDTD
jgi:hypothetical protein